MERDCPHQNNHPAYDPVEGEARGRGRATLVPHQACTVCHRPPGEGEEGRRVEEVSAGKVDRPGYWGPSMLWLPPRPKLRRRGPHTMVVNSELVVQNHSILM